MRYMIDTYGNVDLGTLEWSKEGLNFYTDGISNKIKKPKNNNTVANIYCNLYRAVALNAPFVEGDMAAKTTGELYIRNTKYTTTAEFKEAMKGQILRYELETPANGGYLPMNKGRYKVSDNQWAKIKQMRYMTTTKNLFGYSSINIANDMANGTIIESLPNGAIVQGDAGADPGSSSYSSGWFRPGYSSNSPVIKPYLLAGDTVTVSCDYLILERSYSTLTTVGIYLYDSTHGLTDVTVYDLEVGKLYRLTATYTVDAEGDYFPTFTINSNKTKVTNIQIEKGSTATPYVPYGYLPLK